MSKAPKQKKAQLHYAPYQSASVRVEGRMRLAAVDDRPFVGFARVPAGAHGV